MSRAPRVVVVDDEENIRFVVAHELRAHKFDVAVADSGRAGLEVIATHQPDVIVLDVMLPDIDGFTVLQQLRDNGIATPVVFLSARDGTHDRVRGLTGGANDYVTKPFAIAELVARVKLRLAEGNSYSDRRLRCADLILDEESHDVTRNSELVQLSPTEFRLLRVLLIDQGRVLSRGQLLERVWDYDFDGDLAIVDTYISYLRRKVDTGSHKLIHTIRGVGFTLRHQT
jgi:two-component system, OmpR family, response regulator